MTRKPLVPIRTNRDLLIFQLGGDQALVVGCDSAGGIGPKPLDKVKVDSFTLGKFTARAALMEVLAVGADPVCVVDALSVEPEPTGAEIIRGIRHEAEIAGLDPRLAVTGSTEKNVVVEQTGIGVTVIGACKAAKLKMATSKAGDVVVAVGVACVGQEVLPAEKAGRIADTTDVLKLRSLRFVHEVLPVGSLGVRRETLVLAEGSRLAVEMLAETGVDVDKSAGPATVVLASLPADKVDGLKLIFKKPVTVVARLRHL
ncbi:MAG: AIR synthase related protein [Candidatus Bathyarchaeia archaeon]